LIGSEHAGERRTLDALEGCVIGGEASRLVERLDARRARLWLPK
jgi:hypothetical protein